MTSYLLPTYSRNLCKKYVATKLYIIKHFLHDSNFMHGNLRLQLKHLHYLEKRTEFLTHSMYVPRVPRITVSR